MQQIHSGAYLADDFADGLDAERWQTFLSDATAQVADGRLTLSGRSKRAAHTITGIVTRRLTPSDAVLLAEMRVPTDLTQPGAFGFGAHLSTRMIGEENHPFHAPDSGSDVLFGRFAGRIGWFHGGFGGTRVSTFAPEPFRITAPAGDETTAFRTVRIAYSESEHRLETAVLHGADWIWVGQTKRLRRMISAVELVAELEGAHIEWAVEFRNVRLFPHPARHPVRVLVKSLSGKEARVTLSPLDSPEALVGAPVRADGSALLFLPTDAIFPMAGHLRLEVGGRLLDERRIEAKGVWGLYPGDVFNAMTGLFHI